MTARRAPQMDDVVLGVLELGFAGRAAGLCVLGSSSTGGALCPNRPQFRSGSRLKAQRLTCMCNGCKELIANNLTLTTHLSRSTMFSRGSRRRTLPRYWVKGDLWETAILPKSGSITNVMTNQSVTWLAEIGDRVEGCKNMICLC